MITTISVEMDALRLLHRAVSEAYANWPGGDANEQACLLNMKTQLYAALWTTCWNRVPSEPTSEANQSFSLTQ